MNATPPCNGVSRVWAPAVMAAQQELVAMRALAAMRPVVLVEQRAQAAPLPVAMAAMAAKVAAEALRPVVWLARAARKRAAQVAVQRRMILVADAERFPTQIAAAL